MLLYKKYDHEIYTEQSGNVSPKIFHFAHVTFLGISVAIGYIWVRKC